MSSTFFSHLSSHLCIFTLAYEKHDGFPVQLSFTVPYIFQIRERGMEDK